MPNDSRSKSLQPASGGERLRVLFLIDELDIGGTEQQILELSRRIDRRRFEPLVCCFRTGRKSQEITDLGVRVLHVPKRHKADPGLILRVANLLRRERIDLLQTYLWTANTWGRLAARVAGTRHVLASERNVDIWEEPYKRVIGRWLARSTDRIIANSEAVRRYLLERGGLSPARVVTVYNGVNFDRFSTPVDREERRSELGLPADAVLAGVVARVEAAKDHATLLRAFALTLPRAPQLHLAVVGTGSEIPALEQIAAELGITPHVHFLGMRPDSAQWLQTFDISVLSSVKEGLSNTILESMAAGRPVVATAVGGNPETIVDGHTGFVVPPRDPAAFAQALGQLATSAEMRETFGRAGRERVHAEFSVDSMVSRTEQLYLEVASSATRTSA